MWETLKILFVCQDWQSFVQKDFDILREAYPTRGIRFRGVRDFPSLWRGVLWSDLTYSWFGKLHAFFALLFSKILGKKAVVVAGGDDVAKWIVAKKPYGLCAHPLKRWFAYFIFQNADLVVTVSKFNTAEAIHNAGADPAKTRLIYHGFDGHRFKWQEGKRERKAVITVAHISMENYHRKGLKLFVEAASLLPECHFYLVGPSIDRSIDLLKQRAPPNLSFLGASYNSDLVELLSKAAVYVQASEWESFGCSLAEAMLCECVPVVFNGTALPEVVGGSGFFINRLTPEALAAGIRLAQQNPQVGQAARARIVTTFPLEKRRQELLAVVASLGRKACDE